MIDVETGEPVAAIEKPWAVDANGVEVATRYVTDGSNLVQVVDHRQADIAFPVTADPKYFTCDAYTHLCVKFSKSETKKIRNRVDEGATAAIFAGVLCTGIPALIGKATCAAAVALVGTKLRKSFVSAAKNGKCIELHFFIPSGVLTRWKTVNC
ncbi:hypothetical protein H9L21_14160 [Aeromicrobium senzhongii]|uniref:Uncharacterized protein n=1 Tax=Aeromicrobium senzhongii TaxID=2663859 RepID=A0ABX6SS28_9ACTN|nr:hypothetical protein [Aeromicrobium senzhongii]MTB89670.1 hypothetical protein [Aeromicrobium senzhongii]QNL94204.1 hypothetical protein H9L21_14160 [Aeromicrobium senzhongii]